MQAFVGVCNEQHRCICLGNKLQQSVPLCIMTLQEEHQFIYPYVFLEHHVPTQK